MRKIYLHKRFDSFNLVASTFEAILPQITSNIVRLGFWRIGDINEFKRKFARYF